MTTKLKLLFLFVLSGICGYTNKANAQQGEGISYQAVLRNNSGSPIASTNVNMQFSILLDSASGTSVYTETQMVMTNAQGLANVMIGNGTATVGTWKGIQWNSGPYYINVKVDPAGGSSFTDIGTTQLVSVAYAKQSNGVTLFQNGTQNPYKMAITHSPYYPTWGLRYNDTLDNFELVGGGIKSISLSSWSGDIIAYNPYPASTYPFSSNSYGNITAQGNITTGNKVQRGSDTSNMIALAWGTISSTGSIINASNNVSIAAHATGIFDIAIAGETYSYLNYTTVVSTGGAGFISWGSLSGNLRVFTYNTTGSLTDQFFTFVIFKK